MNSFSWWEAQPREVLEQGDVIATGLQVQPVYPVKFLAKGVTGKGGKTPWDESDVPQSTSAGSSRILGVASGTHGLVLSHGCEIDKIKAAQTVLIAPVEPLSTLAEDLQGKIVRQEVFRYLPLMNVPGLGDLYANLGKTFSLQLRLVDPANRVSSMTDDARFRLGMQLIAFYTRMKP